MLASVLLACGCAPAQKDVAEVSVSPETAQSDAAAAAEAGSVSEAKVREACQDFFDENELTGLAVATVDNGSAAYYCFGSTDEGGAEITENTRFEIASVSKTFCALLLSMMVNEGKVALDDPVADYLDFQIPVYDDGTKITLETLATHTSGLPRMPLNYKESLNPYADYDMDKLREYFESGPKLASKPGEAYAYSNLGFGVLGIALTNAAGMDFDSDHGYEALLKKYILEPLGMASTAINLSEAEEETRARPHTALGTLCRNWDFDALAACGALKSTPADMVKYISAAMGQGDVPGELSAGFNLAFEDRFSSADAHLGLGFFITEYASDTYYWHNGESGGYQSMMVFSPESGRGVVVLCNNCVSVYDLGMKLLAVMR